MMWKNGSESLISLGAYHVVDVVVVSHFNLNMAVKL